jgi:hypothetical protein
MEDFEVRQQKIKDFAEAKPGRMVEFIEGGDVNRTVRVGRVVGYYWNLCQLIVSVKFSPKYPIDLTNRNITILASGMVSGHTYCMVGLDELHGAKVGDSRHPHKCTRCGSPALSLFRFVECSNPSCPCYRKP